MGSSLNAVGMDGERDLRWEWMEDVILGPIGSSQLSHSNHVDKLTVDPNIGKAKIV